MKTDTETLVGKLRLNSRGVKFWRVQDKETKAYTLQFEYWDRLEAEQWFAENEHFYDGYELAEVTVVDTQSRLMQEAADRLEELEKALRYLLTVSDPLFSYGVKELQAARARARKALRMDK